MKLPLKLFLYGLPLFFHSITPRSTLTLDQDVSVTAFDKTTGILYGGSAANNGIQTVFKMEPLNEIGSVNITGLATDDYLDNPDLTIDMMALAHRATTNILTIGNPFLVLHTNADVQQLYIKDVITGEHAETATIKDTNNVAGTIKKIAVTEAIKNNNDNNYYNCIFTAIAQNGQPFAEGNAGLSFTVLNNSLIPTNYQTIALNNTSRWVDLGKDSTPDLANHIVLKWDQKLQRLFAGIAGSSLNTQPPDAYAFATLSCFKIHEDFNKLSNIQLNNDIANYGIGDDAASSTIIAISQDANNKSIAIINLDTTYTSTQKNYVIIHGGLGTLTTANKKIFALPLVGLEGDVPGSLATVLDRATGYIDFTKRTPGATYLYRETDTPVIVGGGPLPFTNNDCTVKKMEAVGDTVYVALSGFQGGDNQPGFYFSQAIFNETGGIKRWTSWERIITLDTFNDSLIDFAVDPARGKIWTLPNVRHITRTDWIYSTDLTTFCGQINSALEGPCYSQLFLGKHTENFGNKVTSHYAFFGSVNKVIVVRTGVSNAASYTAATTPTSEWDDTTNAALEISAGLEEAGIIYQILYTGTDEDTTSNYLFANTQDGLYAFCSNDNRDGFNIRDALNDQLLTTLDHDNCIFKTGHWEPLETDGRVLKMSISPVEKHVYLVEEIGGSLFLTSIHYTNNIDDFQYGAHQSSHFFADHGITTIYDMKTVKYSTLYGLLIATNKGLLFFDITTARFNIVSHEIVTHISIPKYCRNHESFCVVEKQDDFSVGNAAEKYFIQQFILPTITGTTLPNIVHYNPHHSYTTNINLLPLTTETAAQVAYLQYLPSITTPILNFGSLRFFGMRIFNDNLKHSGLVSLPYQVGPLEHTIEKIDYLINETLLGSHIIHWVDHIGSGYIMAGTEKGVISLE